MKVTQYTETVNLNKVKYLITENLIKILIDNNAIIFGGYVRDKYIHDYFCYKFYKKDLNMEKFDDETYDVETKGRLLVANDIDVFFQGSDKDVDSLLTIIRQAGYYICDNEINLIYFKDENIKHRKAIVKINNMNIFGLPKVEVLLDIIYTTKDNIEPPFGKLDLLCNGFILDKTGIRLSNQTGLHCDGNFAFSRKKKEIKILQKMVKFETNLVFIDDDSMQSYSIKNRKIRVSRILKMQLRGWTINNNFYTIEYKYNISKDEACHICADKSFDGHPKIIRLSCCGLLLDISCFNAYLKSEYDSRVIPKCCNTECLKDWVF